MLSNNWLYSVATYVSAWRCRIYGITALLYFFPGLCKIGVTQCLRQFVKYAAVFDCEIVL